MSADTYVADLASAVDLTHPGLGQLAAMSVVCAKANKCMLTIAPPGCGKSAISDWLERVHPEAYKKQSLTRSSLKVYEDLLNGFRGLIVFDDVGAIDTEWSRIQTLVTMAEIVYGHFVSKDSHQLHIDIDDFQGASILNIQPNVLKEVIEHPTWHSNLADKSLRWYHLRRALVPNTDPISAEVDWGLPIQEMTFNMPGNSIWDEILSIGLEQWTLPRAQEHCLDLLRAVTALAGTPEPGEAELDVLLWLMRPMTVEMELVTRQGFGSKASLDDNLLYMLVEFATYPSVTLEMIATDYHFKPSQVQRIISHMIDWFQKVDSNPTRYQPTQAMLDLLKKAGIR